MKNLEQLKEQYQKLGEEIKKLETIIRVPENIKIEWGDSYKGIQFGEKQCLFFRYDEKIYRKNESFWDTESFYRVGGRIDANVRPTRLIKCNRGDLKCGDLAHRSDHRDIQISINDKDAYCFILNDKEDIYIDDNRELLISKLCWNNWYKLEPIEEK